MAPGERPATGGSGPLLTRRTLLALGSGVALGAALSACGLGSAGGSGSSVGNSGTASLRPGRNVASFGTAGSPARVLATRWDADPWSLGSYSALPPGTAASARSVLAQTVIADRVVLAGEYTAVDFPSTVRGAYESGGLAAEQLLAAAPQAATAVVIGAGLAGLAAAEQLRAAGLAVTVFEARDRVGGRIETNREWGVPLEFGAAWLHGLTGHPLVKLVKSAGLTLAPTDYDDAITHSYRTGADSPEAVAAADDLVTRLDDLGSEDLEATDSAAAVLAADGWREDTPDRRFAAASEAAQEYGRDLDGLGAQALSEGQEYQGGDALVVGGFDQVPKQLARNLDVKLGVAATEVLIPSGEAPGGVQVNLAGGGTVRADVAVVAVPLPLLQRSTPKLALPAATSAALASLTTGNLEKVFCEYPRQWWPQATVLQVSETPAERWTEFYNLQPITDRPILVGLAGGVAATTRPATADGCGAEAADILQRAFPAS